MGTIFLRVGVFAPHSRQSGATWGPRDVHEKMRVLSPRRSDAVGRAVRYHKRSRPGWGCRCLAVPSLGRLGVLRDTATLGSVGTSVVAVSRGAGALRMWGVSYRLCTPGPFMGQRACLEG